jgi:hypothetical protein
MLGNRMKRQIVKIFSVTERGIFSIIEYSLFLLHFLFSSPLYICPYPFFILFSLFYF